eukprot:11417804-Alexandrium_andersonii.AAC.1
MIVRETHRKAKQPSALQSEATKRTATEPSHRCVFSSFGATATPLYMGRSNCRPLSSVHHPTRGVLASTQGTQSLDPSADALLLDPWIRLRR